METLRNINPVGTVDVVLIHRQGLPEDKVDDQGEPLEGTDRWGFGCLEPGEEFDVTDTQAEQLLQQLGNYELVDVGREKARRNAIANARAELLEEGEVAHDWDVHARAKANADKPAKKTAAKKAAAKTAAKKTGE